MFPRLMPFPFFLIHIPLLLFFRFFWLKWIEGIKNFHFKSHSFINRINKICNKIWILWKFKILRKKLFSHYEKWSDKFPLWTLIIVIGWKMSSKKPFHISSIKSYLPNSFLSSRCFIGFLVTVFITVCLQNTRLFRTKKHMRKVTLKDYQKYYESFTRASKWKISAYNWVECFSILQHVCCGI